MKKMKNSLDASKITKYINQLVIPPVYSPKVIRDPSTREIISHNYIITMTEFMQQILPKGFPLTTVWGYGGNIIDPCNCENTIPFRNSPGATFEATRGIPINVQWINNITTPNLLPVDPTLH